MYEFTGVLTHIPISYSACVLFDSDFLLRPRLAFVRCGRRRRGSCGNRVRDVLWSLYACRQRRSRGRQQSRMARRLRRSRRGSTQTQWPCARLRTRVRMCSCGARVCVQGCGGVGDRITDWRCIRAQHQGLLCSRQELAGRVSKWKQALKSEARTIDVPAICC